MADRTNSFRPTIQRYAIAVIYLFIGVSLSTILFAAPLKALEMGASDVLLGTLVSAFVSSGLILSIAGAALCNRFGERALLIGAFACYATAQLIGAVTGNLVVLLGAAILAGVGDMLFTIGGMTYLTQATSGGKGSLLSSSFGLLSLGAMIGSAVGGNVAEGYGFGAVFILGMLISISGFLLTLILPKQNNSPLAESPTPFNLFSAYKAAYDLLRRNSQVRMAASLLALSTIGWFTFRSSFYLSHLLRVGMTTGTIGLVAAAGTAVRIVAPFIYAWMARRMGPLQAIVVGVAGGALGLAVTPFFTAAPALGLIGAASQLGDSFALPGGYALVGVHTDASDRSTSVAIINMSWALAALCGGPLWGAVVRITGLSAGFLIAGLGIAAAAVALGVSLHSNGLMADAPSPDGIR